jgi:hypothetical protein
MGKKRPTKRQMRETIKHLRDVKEIPDNRNVSIRPQDVVDWLTRQEEAPHPLNTSLETMILWMEAMDARVPRNNLQRRMRDTMQLWREQGDLEGRVVTREQQDLIIEQHGADLDPPVLTISWQTFRASRLDFTSLSMTSTSPLRPAPRSITDAGNSTQYRFTPLSTISTAPVAPISGTDDATCQL